MRRSEKEIVQKPEIESVIYQSTVCRIAMSDNDIPYIVPLCFGYRDGRIYVHCSLKGKKIDILRKNRNVCFEFDHKAEVVKAENACKWGMKYVSVIGFGKASFIENPEGKRKALEVIMNQYAEGSFRFSEKEVNGTAVIEIEIESMTGKQSEG
ncbi:MAG: pyridoxamine 5'-phosphate oxidase family protein [Desulfobacteraceae bacterium]